MEILIRMARQDCRDFTVPTRLATAVVTTTSTFAASGPDALQQTLDALRAVRIAGPSKRAATGLKQQEALASRLRAAVVAQVPAFSASGNPDLLPELERHAQEHLLELGRLLSGGALGDFDFVRTHMRRRASQRFPLEALLLGYRCMQPLWMEALSGPPAASASHATRNTQDPQHAAWAAFAAEYTGAVGIVAAAEYVAQTRLSAEVEGDRRNELLSTLVSGYDEADARVARLLKRAGYLEQRLSFCVALAQSTDPLEMENPARAQRIVESVAEAVAPLSVRVLVGLRSNLVTAVFSDVRRVSGWTAPQAALADRVLPRLLTLGPAVLIGLSSDQPSTAFIPQGLHEATVALDFASVAERVVPFASLPLRRLLIHRGADYVQAALPPWFAKLREADAQAHGVLLQSLRALADADMNVQGAARMLGVHPNTVYARIDRVQLLTGQDARRFHDLTHLLLAADCSRP
jgi:hypothetical protein